MPVVTRILILFGVCVIEAVFEDARAGKIVKSFFAELKPQPYWLRFGFGQPEGSLLSDFRLYYLPPYYTRR
jgi:hypothetical protein